METFFLQKNYFEIALFRYCFLSHNNLCFQCNTAITNFLVSNTYEIRFNDVIGQSTVPVFLRKNSKTWLTYIFKWVYFVPLFFNTIRLIQLCDKKNLTFVDCWDKNYIKLVLKNVIKRASGELNNIFQDSFNIILSQQLTHDRSYISCAIG